MPALQPLGGGQHLLGLDLQAEQAPGDLQQLPADIGDLDLATAAVEQAHAVALLERPDLAGEGRLGHVQVAGGLGETAFGRDRVKGRSWL